MVARVFWLLTRVRVFWLLNCCYVFRVVLKGLLGYFEWLFDCCLGDSG